MKTLEKRLNDVVLDADKINDQMYLAVQHNSAEEMDRAGRDLVRIGNVIKDLAYEMKREAKS